MIHVCNPTFDLLACLSELDAISSWCFMFDTENLTPSASLKSVVLKLESINFKIDHTRSGKRLCGISWQASFTKLLKPFNYCCLNHALYFLLFGDLPLI